MSESYDPNSPNAMFTRVLLLLEQQGRDSMEHRTELRQLLVEVKAEAQKTNGRVTSLEHWRTGIKAKVAIASAIGGTGAAFLFEKIFN